MERMDLAGAWTLRVEGLEPELPGRLPGCNYLDLMAAGVIPDPFWGTNEADCKWVAERGCRYRRTFSLTAEQLGRAQLDLVISGLDTLAEIRVNGAPVAGTENCFRTYRIPLRPHVRAGENELEIAFQSPLAAAAERHARRPLTARHGVKGRTHLRKVQSHYGWDWGPLLPPSGIFGAVGIEAYDRRIGDVQISQQHHAGGVTLTVETQTAGGEAGHTGDMRCLLRDPDGAVSEQRRAFEDGRVRFVFEVAQPRLWWCNGLGAQPLYGVELALLDERGAAQDTLQKHIGLRTVELDRSADALGSNFRFLINGVSLFAKGANWIPPDAFPTRVTAEDLRFYVESAARANMNMLRVWGGGYYGSDAFYDLCDRYGILVWQDFPFACGACPFDEPAFLEEVRREVADNVARIRHHASLALWCGSNENELYSMLWKSDKALYEANYDFYYSTLADWTRALDGATPYWPGSPSSGRRDIPPHHLLHGNTHLWDVWHGMMPATVFRKLPTRFCSEFGVESFPSMQAIRAFTDHDNLTLDDPDLMFHQRSGGGNQKILFYLLASYPNPARFEDFIYLSQLTQADNVCDAVEAWRQRTGLCNGALYWQFNDCWPAASWSGIDAAKRYKALHYRARRSFKPLCLSAELYDDRAVLHVLEDLPGGFDGELRWQLIDFAGTELASGAKALRCEGQCHAAAETVVFDEYLPGARRKDAALCARLVSRGGAVLHERSWLLVPDKQAALPKVQIAADIRAADGIVELELRSDRYARAVFVELPGVAAPLSDNFFDLLPEQPRVITAPLLPGADIGCIRQGLRVRSLADVAAKTGPLADRLLRLRMQLAPKNLIAKLLYRAAFGQPRDVREILAAQGESNSWKSQ